MGKKIKIPGDLGFASAITIAGSGGSITIHCDSGEVEYPDNLPEAAKTFWDAMRDFFPGMGRCQTCRWWALNDDGGNLGECARARGLEKGISRGHWVCGGPLAALMTSADWGCVSWKIKD